MADRSGPPPLPGPLRAVLGVVATVADAVRDGSARPEGLTDRVLELPVLAVSTALQLSLRAQQRYTALTVRGDELLTALRGGASDDPPPWATFEDDLSAPAAPADPPPPANSTPAARPAKPAGPRKSATKKAAAKPPPAGRNGKPSAFDLVGDDLIDGPGGPGGPAGGDRP